MSEPKVIVISLVRSQSRRKKFIPLLEQSGLEWEILDAVDGLQMQSTPREYHEQKVIRLLGFPLSASEIACFLSHRLAWAKCIEMEQPVLILEDDFVFEPHFNDTLNVAMSHRNEWDILRLQGLTESLDSVVLEQGAVKVVKNLGDPLGATAYLIQPSAAKRLIKCSQDIYEPLDHFLEHDKKHRLKILAIKPYSVSARENSSTILDRPERMPIHSIRKLLRSLWRACDRFTNPNPWFPK